MLDVSVESPKAEVEAYYLAGGSPEMAFCLTGYIGRIRWHFGCYRNPDRHLRAGGNRGHK